MPDLFPDSLPSISEQIEEVRRELDMRNRKYPDFIRKGYVTKERAAIQIARLCAVLNTLEQCAANQQTDDADHARQSLDREDEDAYDRAIKEIYP